MIEYIYGSKKIIEIDWRRSNFQQLPRIISKNSISIKKKKISSSFSNYLI